jgi:hypothetical protein
VRGPEQQQQEPQEQRRHGKAAGSDTLHDNTPSSAADGQAYAGRKKGKKLRERQGHRAVHREPPARVENSN